MDSVKIIQRQNITAKALKTSAESFVAALQQRNIAREVPNVIPLRVRQSALPAIMRSRHWHRDAVTVHAEADAYRGSAKGLHPAGSLTEVHAYDVACLMSRDEAYGVGIDTSRIDNFIKFATK